MAAGQKPDSGERRSQRQRKSSRSLATRMRVLGTSELKRQTFYALENTKKGGIPAKIAGYALFALIVANAVAVCVTVQAGIETQANTPLAIFYLASTVCFCIEYIARIWIADLAFGNCTRFQARLKYILSPLGVIDLLSFAPSMVSWFAPISLGLIHAIGVLRLIRLVKITRYMRGFRTMGRVMSKHYHEIVAAFLVIGLLIVVASVAMYEIEHPAQPDKFDSLFSGVWWAVQTVTSTGYGDIVPITPLGRAVGGVIMLLALGLIAIPGGIFSAGFVAEFQNANLRKIERDVRHSSEHGSGEQREGEEPPDGEAASRDREDADRREGDRA